MELQGERLIPASIDATWAALNDPQVLQACIPGCESLQRTDDGGLLALLALKVGPVSARFKGRVRLDDVVPPRSYTLHFDGQGGVAGHGKGSAEVRLEPEGAQQTRLHYHARAQVGGKLAQVGSRLVDATAGKITEEFFSAFESALSPPAGAEAAPVAAAPAARPAWLWWVVGAVALLVLWWWVSR